MNCWERFKCDMKEVCPAYPDHGTSNPFNQCKLINWPWVLSSPPNKLFSRSIYHSQKDNTQRKAR